MPDAPACPKKLNIQPPRIAPTMPMMRSPITPPGPSPGTTYFARKPAIRPTTSQAIILIANTPVKEPRSYEAKYPPNGLRLVPLPTKRSLPSENPDETPFYAPCECSAPRRHARGSRTTRRYVCAAKRRSEGPRLLTHDGGGHQ